MNIKGTGVALITPFNKDFSIDFEGLKRMVNHIIDGGLDYIVVLGTTGETATLNKKEKETVFKAVAEYTNNRIPLVAGLGGNNTLDLIETITHFDFTGYSGILSVSPYYNKPNQNGIYMHYKMVAEASPIPVIIYNVPGRTGSNISPETVCRLAKDCHNIIAVKEASGNLEQCMNIVQRMPANFAVTSGDDSFTLPFMSIGMCGVISVIANAYPAQMSALVNACLNKDYDKANQLHYKLYELMKLIFADGSPGGIKYILNKLGLCETTVRLPLHDISEQTAVLIDAAMLEFSK
jgi:4-hydroxy-tetrahydrodipicolinate synthase